MTASERPDAGKKRRLTKSVVANAQPHPNGRSEYVIWDDRIVGFGLRVRPNGVKSYTYKYKINGTPKRITITANSPDEAYEHAKALSFKRNGGIDPAAEKREATAAAQAEKEALRIADVLDEFVAAKSLERKPKTVLEYARVVEKILKPRIGSIKADELTAKDVSTMHRELLRTPRQPKSKKKKQAAKLPPAKAQADGAIRLLKIAMNWSIGAGLRTNGNPAAGIKLDAGKRRERLFSDAEVARMHAAMDAMEKAGKLTPTVALGIRLLFATGCRAGEICGLEWANVDLERGMLRWPTSKTGYLQKPITPECRELLEGPAKALRVVGVPWVCPSPLTVAKATDGGRREQPKHLRVETLEGGFERVMKVAAVEAETNASLHLIRHWFATKIYKDETYSLFIRMAIVGHKSVATAKRYTHVTPEEAVMAATDMAVRRLSDVEAAKGRGAVVPISGGER